MITDEEAREAAREILSADAYTRWSSEYEAWLGLIDRLAELTPDFVFEALHAIGSAFKKLGEWVVAFFDALGVQGNVAPFLGWIGAGAILVALIALIAQWRLRRAAEAPNSTDRESESNFHAEAVREADRAAQSGLFLEAAHRVQLASLAFLIEAGWVELARSDANPTLRQRVAGSALPELEREALISLVDRLERRWFGASAAEESRAPVAGGASEGGDRALYEEWIALDARLSRLGTRSQAA